MSASILVVDDAPENRALVMAVLGWHGFTVGEAGNGVEALRAIEQDRPDLVITDLLMPEMDGFELARRVATMDEPIRVVFYSATYNIAEAMRLGAHCAVVGVLPKPVEPDEIVAVVRRALDAPVKRAEGSDREFSREHVKLVTERATSALLESRANTDRLNKLKAFGASLLAADGWPGIARTLCGTAREMTLAAEAAVGLYHHPSGVAIRESLDGVFVERRGFRQDASAEPPGAADGAAAAALAARLGLVPPSPDDVLALPLDAPSRRHGWLCVAGKLGGGSFTVKDGETLASLVAQASLACENAYRLEELTARARELSSEVSERKRVEEELRAVEWGKTLALEAAHASVWQHDLVSDVIHADGTAVFGSPSDQRPIHFADFIAAVHPDDRARVQHVVAKSLESGEDIAFEFRTLLADGFVRWIETKAHVVSHSGRPVSVVGISVDITERRALETQLREAQKMEAIGRLAGGIAHDFNNMLTAILGFNELLTARALDSATREDLAEIRGAAERAAALTRQLLAFSRRQVLQPEVVDFQALVAGLVPMLRRLIGEDVQLATASSAALPHAHVDAGQWEQVLLNLVVNAREAMPDGGRLDITVSNRTLDADACAGTDTAPGVYLAVEVRDTGIGMDEDTRKHMFEPFFTTKKTGTGLGLATVYGIVTQSGGVISVASAPGHGTAFTILLPAWTSEVPARAEAAAGATPVQRGHETVLLAEDEQTVRTFATRVLEGAGYTVLATSDRASAVEAATRAASSIDILVTDMVMPGGSGADLYASLAAGRPGLKVLFMSGFTGDHAAFARPIPRGAFLQKPFTGDALARQVRTVLDATEEATP